MRKMIRFSELGGPDVLRVVEEALPEPGEGEVRLAQKAIGVNRADTLFRQNMYIESPELGGTGSGLGYESAAVVDAVGPGVSVWKAGDEVVVIPSFSVKDYPAYGSHTLAPASALAPKPAGLSWAEAAAYPMPFYTDYFALFDFGKVDTANYAVIVAAASSTGIAGIQLAKRAGAKVIATSRSSSKREALLAMGADAFVATEEEDVTARLIEITGGAGVDFVFDPIGGPMIRKWAGACAPLARIAIYGTFSFDDYALGPMELLGKGLTITGYRIFDYTGHNRFGLPRNEAAMARAEAYFASGFADGSLKPVVATSFPLTEAAAAHRYLESNTHIGKVVLTVD